MSSLKTSEIGQYGRSGTPLISGHWNPKGGGKQTPQRVAGPLDLLVSSALYDISITLYSIDQENVYTSERRPHIERSICAL